MTSMFIFRLFFRNITRLEQRMERLQRRNRQLDTLRYLRSGR